MKLKSFILTVLLLAGAAGSVSAQRDITSQYITNAKLSNGTTGWTVSNFKKPKSGNNTVGYATEAYAGWGSLETTSFSLTQNITLPAGSYRLANYSFFRQGEAYNTNTNKSLGFLKAGGSQIALQTLGSVTVGAYANSQEEGANCFDAKMYRNFVEFNIAADNTTIEIGIVGTFDEMRSWCIVGMFELFDLNDAASSSSPTDVTYSILNSGFEYCNANNWTSTNCGGYANNNNFGSKAGIGFVERWQSSANGGLSNGSFTQTITNMPNGLYELSVYAQNIEQYNNDAGGRGMYVKANNDRTEISTSNQYKVRTTVTDGTLTVGIQLDGCTGNWIAFDRFGLLFYGDPLQAYKDLLAEKVAEAQALVDGNTLRTGAANALQDVIDANDNDDDAFTEEVEFNTAISNIEAAMVAANEVAAAYPAYDAFRAKVAALEDGVPSGQSKTQFDNALASADAAVDNATTPAAVNEQITAIRSAAMTFISTTDGSFNITFLASQLYSDWKKKDGSAAGIVQDQFLTDRPATIPPFAESYETTCATIGNVLYQTVSNLPEGYYQVEMYAQALYTPRGFDTEATEGDANRSFAFASDQRTGLPIKFGTSVAFADLTTLNVNVHLTTDGDLTFGVTKDANGSNWHFAQIASIVYSNQPDLTNLKATRDALVAEAVGLLGSADAYLLTVEQQQALQDAIDQGNAASTFDDLNTVTLTTLPNAIATARQQIAAAKENRMRLIAALERFERDYNLTDGTDYGRLTMSAEAWTTLLDKVNDVTEALDNISLAAEYGTRAQALEDQMNATDASIRLFRGYLSLLNGVNGFDDSDLNTAYTTYGTNTSYTDDDTNVQAAITALDEAFQQYTATQHNNFEAGAGRFLGLNLDFESANGDAIDSTWPNVYNQTGWTTLFESDATSDNKQYAYLIQDNASPREGGAHYVRIRQKWATHTAPHMQILKQVMIPTGRYELQFYIKSESSGANMSTDLNYYLLGEGSTVSVKPTSNTWTKHTYEIVTEKPTFLDLSFGFKGEADSEASVWVDDITLTYMAVSEFQIALDEARAVTHAATASAVAEYEGYEGHEDQFESNEARLEAIYVLRNAKIIAENSGSVNSLLVNADFTGGVTDKTVQGSGGQVKVPAGWDFDYSFDGWNDTNVANGVFNAWAGTINKAELMQTVQYLPNGIYRLTALAGTDTDDGSSTVAIYINPNDYSHVGRSQEVIILNSAESRLFGEYDCAAEVSKASGHQLTVGIYSLNHYYQVKDFSLTFLGETESAQTEAASSYLRQDYFWQRGALEWTATDDKYGKASQVVVYPQQKNQLITTGSLDWWANTDNKIVNDVCQHLVLTDGQGQHSGYAFHTSTAFTAVSAEYDRSFTEGTRLTVCLPYAPTGYNGTFYTLSDVSDTHLYFQKVVEPQPNTPYIFVAGEGGSTLCATNASVEATPESMTSTPVGDHYLVGVFDNTQVENIYGFTKTGKLAFATSSSMNPFRSFIQSPTSSGAISYALFDENTSEGIQMVFGDDTLVDVYTVSGRMVRKNVKRSEALNGLSRGVYIIGGTKIVK